MIFEPVTEFTQNYFKHWVSKEGKWEIGFTKMMFGVRVRFGAKGASTCELDYCAGADPDLQQELMSVVMKILLEIPESVTWDELREVFPRETVKPIHLDPIWPILRQKADESMARLYEKTNSDHQHEKAG